MTTPRLFHVAVPGVVQSRTFRCIWLLEELDVDFEICMLTPGQPYGPQMRSYGVQQSRKLPTMQMDGEEITDSGVICQVLAERYGALTGDPRERLEMLQWMAMAETCITFRIPLLPALMKSGQSLDVLRSQALEPMRDVFLDNIQRFEAHFASGSDYLLQSGFSVADVMCGWSLHTMHGWRIMDLEAGDSPETLAWLERLQARPAFRRTQQYAELAPGLYQRGGAPLPDEVPPG